eukprot:1195540-Prorocentrum_minimum.AAC.4
MLAGPSTQPAGPIRRRKRGYILTMDQSDAGNAGIFSRWTNQTQVSVRFRLRLLELFPRYRSYPSPVMSRRWIDPTTENPPNVIGDGQKPKSQGPSRQASKVHAILPG